GSSLVHERRVQGHRDVGGGGTVANAAGGTRWTGETVFVGPARGRGGVSVGANRMGDGGESHEGVAGSGAYFAEFSSIDFNRADTRLGFPGELDGRSGAVGDLGL